MVNQARRLLRLANAKRTVGHAAFIISTAYLLSRLLGLLRDRLLIAHFGKGATLDAYNAAFRLPELLFTLLVSGAFAVAFIPVFSEQLEKGERDTAWRITSSLLNLLVLGTAAGGIIIGIFADPLTSLLAPGFDAGRHALAVDLTRLMLITPILFAISSVLGSVQQSFNRFLVFAFAGVFYNLGIIAGILWLAPKFSIYGVAWGIIIGVALQALLQIVGLHGLGYKYRPVIDLRLKGVQQTLKLMFPRSLDQGIDQVHYGVETIIGSLLPQGSITTFTLASNLKNVPLALITSSITTAVFPRLAAHAASGAREELIKVYVQTARLILFLVIPSAAFMVVARGYIVRLLYGFGDAATASTLGWFAGTVVFTSLFLLISRIFFAMQDTRTPLYLSLASIPTNIILSFALSQMFGVRGLAMGASIVALLETVSMLVVLHLRQGDFGERDIWRGVWRMALAGGVMALALYFTVSQLSPLYAIDKGFFTLAPKFALLMIVGAFSYLVPCYLLRLNEAHIFIGQVKDYMVRSLNLV